MITQKAKPPIALELFNGGAVLAAVRPELVRDAVTLDRIREWAKAGLLMTTDPQPDPACSLWFPTDAERPVEPLPRGFRPFAGPGSWPWHCGRFARWADDRQKTVTRCPVIGDTRVKWMAGYNGHPDPAM